MNPSKYWYTFTGYLKKGRRLLPHPSPFIIYNCPTIDANRASLNKPSNKNTQHLMSVVTSLDSYRGRDTGMVPRSFLARCRFVRSVQYSVCNCTHELRPVISLDTLPSVLLTETSFQQNDGLFKLDPYDVK
jgi:hypothetical protein